MNKSKIIIISGFSASGKDTLAKKFEDDGAHFVVSHTTRPMRPGERNGYPYYFISNDEFLDMAETNQFIEHRQYNTLVNNIPAIWHYGVHENNVDNEVDNVVVLDLEGTIEFKKCYGDRCIVLFLDVDVEERRERCIKRGDYDATEFNRRNEDDEKKFPKELLYEVVNFTINSCNENETYIEALKLIDFKTRMDNERKN